MVMEVVHEDIGEDNLQCTNHPYKNISPGGICAFCLQEKLRNLVSSSFSEPVFPSSSSSSPSFRSDLNNPQSEINESCNNNGYYTKRSSRLPFVKKNKKDVISDSSSTSMVFNRSNSIATPSRGIHFLDKNYNSLHRRGFWSFLYLSKNPTSKKSEKSLKDVNFTPSTPSTVCSSSLNVRFKEKKVENFVVVDENGSPNEAAFDRKVSRSRSVGCGSKSFGDCTLREGKSKVQSSLHRNSERVRCGGIFSGFMITSSSSSSSLLSNSCSISSSTENDIKNSSHNNVNVKLSYSNSFVRHLNHSRSKSWKWALASPMRAFSNPSSLKRGNNSGSNKNLTPNLAAISKKI